MSAYHITVGDAYCRYDAEQQVWSFGTGLIEQQLQLQDGRLRCISLLNKSTHNNLVDRADSDEFYFTLGSREYSGLTGGYRLVSQQVEPLPTPKASPGIDTGIRLNLVIANDQVEVALNYTVFASTPRTQLGMILKTWKVTNLGRAAADLDMISLQQLRMAPEWINRFSICYWQGGGADAGTNEMRIEPPYRRLGRTFHSMVGMPGYRIDDIWSGSASYHPYFVLHDHEHLEGLFIGHNYLGPWSTQMMNAQQPILEGQDRTKIRTCYYLNTQLEHHREPLAPGASFETPNSFVGVYSGDLDSAAEQLHDWQATFKWDYTREQYLWGSRIYNNNWNNPEHRNDLAKRREDMWQIANLCRTIGANVAHEDDFWFDERGRGDWEGIEWGELVTYLKRSGIHFKLWMPPQHFDPDTTLDRAHPEWQPLTLNPRAITPWYGHGLCSACQEAHDYMRTFILERQKRYGSYIHRFDGWVQSPCFSTSHDHPAGQPFVAQYRHFLAMIRECKDADPNLGFEGCNSGGEWCDWDKLELLEDNQHSDGGGPDDFYYLSYFWTPAKQFGMAGGGHRIDEGWITRQRETTLFERYLVSKGVVGRYMRLYHPQAEGAPDVHTFIQIMDGSRSRGMIRPDQACAQVTVFPKRLQPEMEYTVSIPKLGSRYTALGKVLMHEGITYAPKGSDDRILLNLTDYPGAGTIQMAPSAPFLIVKEEETIWGHNGISLEWSPSVTQGLLAGYEVWRDSQLVDFVAIGTYYFDCAPEASASATYKIVAVDADGNRSI
ncbi:MAG: hypothetical protein GXY52_01585 [Chloroflexi bacterium]|nr:hypothetical protein [Chloroflexota bacterium]